MIEKYNYVTSLEKLGELDTHMSKGHDLIAVDTETNGLHFWKNVVIGISLSTDSKSGFYIPLLTWTPTGEEKTRKVKENYVQVREEGHFTCHWTGKQYPEDVTPSQYEAPEFITSFIRKRLKGQRLIMHNAPFDVLMIESTFGINLEEYVFCDTALLKHILDENTSCGLKETAILWQDLLKLDVSKAANEEQEVMGLSVIANGGKYLKTEKHIWRASFGPLAKYAIADTFLTYGLFEVGMRKLCERENKEKYINWFFEEEIMPLCREVMINMKRKGVNIDVSYFEELERETKAKLEEIEDVIIGLLGPSLSDFDIGISVDDAVTKKSLVERIIELEELDYPLLIKKGVAKKSLSKPAVKMSREIEPHWLWDYILGEGELKYSEKRLEEIKNDIYKEKEGKRYQFNIGSGGHLRWLFCDKFGYSRKDLPQTKTATAKNPIPQMGAEVLEEYFLGKYDFVKPLLVWKKLKKLHSTYILPALTLHNNGVLHMDFMQNGTVSGRFACRGGFNLQTLPQVEELDVCPKCKSDKLLITHPIKLLADIECPDCGLSEKNIICSSAIKEGFIAPEGYDIVNADYSSLEPRVFAFMSGDDKLKEIYWKGLDMYSKMYCDIFDKEGLYSPDPKDENYLKKVAKAKRDSAKPWSLGIPYGARGPQIANMNDLKKKVPDYKNGGLKEILDVNAGWQIRSDYLNEYVELHKYMLKCENDALTKGYVETLGGRRRHFEFTQDVYVLLLKMNTDTDWFLDLPRKDLKTINLNTVFNSRVLADILTKKGIKFWPREETIPSNHKGAPPIKVTTFVGDKGKPRDWSFIRALFQNELNNAKNMPIQGMAGHITNRGMLDITRALKSEGLDAWVNLNVHDEITGYSKKEDTARAVELWKDRMEKNYYTAMMDVPMIAEPLIARTLKDAK